MGTEDIQQVMKDIERTVNTVNFRATDVACVGACFTFFHRTLQQSTIRFLYQIIKWLGDYYEERGMAAVSDDRNKESVNWIKEVAKIEAHFPYI